MSAISNWLANPVDNFSTTLSSGINSSDVTIPVNSVTGLPTEGIGVIFAKDSDGNVDVSTIEFVHWTGISSLNITLSDTGDRGLTGSASGAQAHGVGSYFEVWVSQQYYASARAGFVVEHNANGTHKALTDLALTTPKITTSINDANGNEVIKTPATASAVNEVTVTNAATGDDVKIEATGGDTDISLDLITKGAGVVKANGTEITSIITTTKYAPQGFLLNGKIVPSVASSDLTVAIKGMDGNDPSASNPVYCRIGDTVRTITSALSVTKNAATNWFNAGSTELAAKEIDYFVYLGYNATDGVVLGFARIPYANQYDDFSTTSTNETYAAISTITTAAATDYYELIGRFAATLSAGAGYTWTVPTFTAKNLIQRPIYETRWLQWQPVYSGSGSLTFTSVTTTTARYKVSNDAVLWEFYASGTTGGTTSTDLYATAPMDTIATGNVVRAGASVVDGSDRAGVSFILNSTPDAIGFKKYNNGNWGLGASREIHGTNVYRIK